MHSAFFKEVDYSGSIDFPSRLKSYIKEYKIVYLKNLAEGMNYKSYYADLVSQLGKMINTDEDIITGNATKEQWTDVRYDKNNSFTFRHSNTRQPLHTDAAYASFILDVNFFFCLEQAAIGGATTFIDGADIVKILKTYEPELFQEMQDTEVEFGKGNDQRRKRKIINIENNNIILNWNYYRVSPENSAEVKNICESFHHFLEDKIVAGGLLKPVQLKEGECVFFQDDAVLHGRNSFYGNRTLIKGGFVYDESSTQ